ncbi:hypothetical protein V5279_18135 [Bradyrhizobium sp. 26S5]
MAVRSSFEEQFSERETLREELSPQDLEIFRLQLAWPLRLWTSLLV